MNGKKLLYAFLFLSGIDDAVFPTVTLWELYVAMATRVMIKSRSKPTEAFPPPPNDASDKI